MTDRGRPSTAAANAAAVVFPLRSVGKVVSLRSLRERLPRLLDESKLSVCEKLVGDVVLLICIFSPFLLCFDENVYLCKELQPWLQQPWFLKKSKE